MHLLLCKITQCNLFLRKEEITFCGNNKHYATQTVYGAQLVMSTEYSFMSFLSLDWKLEYCQMFYLLHSLSMLSEIEMQQIVAPCCLTYLGPLNWEGPGAGSAELMNERSPLRAGLGGSVGQMCQKEVRFERHEIQGVSEHSNPFVIIQSQPANVCIHAQAHD